FPLRSDSLSRGAHLAVRSRVREARVFSLHRGGTLAPEFAEGVRDLLFELMDRLAYSCGGKSGPVYSIMSALFMQWSTFAVVSGRYVRAGQQIFDFSDRTVEMLKNTKVHAATCGGLV